MPLGLIYVLLEAPRCLGQQPNTIITVQSSHLGPVFEGHMDPLGPDHNNPDQCSQWEMSKSLCEQKLSRDQREGRRSPLTLRAG